MSISRPLKRGLRSDLGMTFYSQNRAEFEDLLLRCCATVKAFHSRHTKEILEGHTKFEMMLCKIVITISFFNLQINHPFQTTTVLAVGLGIPSIANPGFFSSRLFKPHA